MPPPVSRHRRCDRASLSARLHAAMTDGTWSALKACRYDTCEWALLRPLAEPLGTWCSMAMCGNRDEGAHVSGTSRAAPEPADEPCYVADSGATTLEAMIVAIDGPAGSGKSTVARALARRLGFTYLDSGAHVPGDHAARARRRRRPRRRRGARADRRRARRSSCASATTTTCRCWWTAATSARRSATPRVTGASSTVAAHPQVRAALLAKQRELIGGRRLRRRGTRHRHGRRPGRPGEGVPDRRPGRARAPARGRAASGGGSSTEADEVRARDRAARPLDSTRSAAPLRAAEDAVVIDTTGLEVEQVVERVVALVRTQPRRRPADETGSQGRRGRLSRTSASRRSSTG